ncbi:MAG: HEAT repeat domain-containing protein [Phycisphaerales bacterium]|nr:HEAT repeat domain-containing protein [Phycisphaerales bacterium]
MKARAIIATWAALGVVALAFAQVEGDQGVWRATLLDGSREIPRAARVEAARQLAQRNTPADRQALLQALQERSNQPAQFAAASAIAEQGLVDPQFIDPLFVLIQPDVSIDLARPAARALARFRDDPVILNRLIARTESLSGEPSRRAAIEALGYIPEKRSAERLMELLASPDSSAEIRASAMEALRTLTGIASHGSDVGRWLAWWESTRSLPDADFRAALQASKAARLDELKLQYDRAAAAYRERISLMYRALPPDRRSEQLLDMLNSPEPIERSVAAMIVREDKASAAIIPEAVQERLRAMVSDVDDNVRLSVANALGALNYTPAFESILRQLAVERNPDVKTALTRAIAPMQNLEAVGPLLTLLGDGDLSVAQSAALALRDLGPRLRSEGDPSLLARTTAALRAALARTGGPGAESLREAVVDAMVPLRQPELIADLTRLLGSGQTPLVRRNAIRALAEFRNEDLADAVAPMLADSQPSLVRLAAAQALGSIGRAADIQALRRRLEDPDPTVQSAAWNAIAAIMPKDTTPPEALFALAAEFSGDSNRDRDRRIEVLLALQAKLVARRDLNQLAEVRENIGQALMSYDPPQAEQAITYLRMARDDYKATGSQVGVEKMTAALLRAYLRAGAFADAMRFASEAIAEFPGNVQTVGSEIKREADRLYQLRELAKAEELINHSETIDPPLPDLYRKHLVDMAAEIRRMTSDELRNRTTAPSGPRSASKHLPVLIPIL